MGSLSGIEIAIKDIRKKYGKSAILTSGGGAERIPAISTGSIKLDEAIGIGGYPMGRITQIVGNASSGKTTLALHAIANAQYAGIPVCYIDTEYALDLAYAQNVGVNIDDMYVSQPEYAEQALDIIYALVKSGEKSLIVLDSVAGLVPKREIEGESGDAHVGLAARLMSQAMRRIVGPASTTGSTIIFVNQYRMNISASAFGPQKVTPGGKALEYYSSVILDVARIGKRDDMASKVQVTVKKNKVAPPYRVAKFDIVYGTGIDVAREAVEVCVEHGVIKKSGSWFEFNEQRFQGMDNLIRGVDTDEIRRIATRLCTGGSETQD